MHSRVLALPPFGGELQGQRDSESEQPQMALGWFPIPFRDQTILDPWSFLSAEPARRLKIQLKVAISVLPGGLLLVVLGGSDEDGRLLASSLNHQTMLQGATEQLVRQDAVPLLGPRPERMRTGRLHYQLLGPKELDLEIIMKQPLRLGGGVVVSEVVPQIAIQGESRKFGPIPQPLEQKVKGAIEDIFRRAMAG